MMHNGAVQLRPSSEEEISVVATSRWVLVGSKLYLGREGVILERKAEFKLST